MPTLRAIARAAGLIIPEVADKGTVHIQMYLN
jgi:hypothetical protein